MLRNFSTTLLTIVLILCVLSTLTYSEDKKPEDLLEPVTAVAINNWSSDIEKRISNLHHNIANKLDALGQPQEVQASTQEQLNELSNKVQEIENRLAAVESKIRAIF